METRIEFAADSTKGTKPVFTHLQALKVEAARDNNVLKLYTRILRAMNFITKHGTPYVIGKDLFGEEGGKPFTIKPVKALSHHPPLLELRVNWQGVGAYRAIFFPYVDNGTLYLVFTRSVLKQSTSDPAFEHIIMESTAMLSDFYADPRKYINL